MPHDFQLSPFGLKLIKAYEGFRPAETTLVSGHRVIGYVHRYLLDEEPLITRQRAEEVLLEDLEPYEAMINEHIHAPLTQSQFDALVSLSFNIGPRAFLDSSVMHRLNNGRPLEAASGFDDWCKSIIKGKTYIVDALVRRRTAEKALFLRPVGGVLRASRVDLPPHKRDANSPDEYATPVFDRDDVAGIVEQAPYDAPINSVPQRAEVSYERREDGPAGILTLSELAPPADDDGLPLDEDLDLVAADPYEKAMAETPLENEDGLSPIAVAAAEVSERLERLIANRPDTQTISRDTPLETVEPEPLLLDELAKPDVPEYSVPAPANDGATPEYRRPGRAAQIKTRSPEAYIERRKPAETADENQGFGAFWVAFLIGSSIFGAGFVRWILNPDDSLSEMGAFLAPVATIVGAMIALGAIYYLTKALARGK
jgi:lysozyme